MIIESKIIPNAENDIFKLKLQYEKENNVTLPMTSFIDFELRNKIKERKSLSQLEVRNLVEGFDRLYSLATRVSENLVEESKQHISSEQVVENIRKIFEELY